MFVGRRRELGILRSFLDNALAGSGTLALVAGEPGIGKTSLAARVADDCRSANIAVAGGRCWEGAGAPPFWLWSQALGSFAEVMPGTDPAVADQVGQLMPDIGPVPAPDMVGHERFRLFEAVGEVFRHAGDRRPILVVLDDLQWADVPSLLLLRFLARELRERPVAIVGTYRDVEVGPEHQLTALLAELAGECRHIALGGLDRSEVAEFARALTDEALTAAGEVSLYRATNGNPFFVRELIYLRVPVVRSVPDSVLAVLERRVGRLSPACAGLLAAAAALGQDCDVAVVATVVGRSVDDVSGLVAEAAAARLLELPVGRDDRFSFSHALVREALYAKLPQSERVELHIKAADAIEQHWRGDLEPRLGELAHHLWRAGIDPERAADYATRAGHSAMRALAYEDAARHFRRAVRVLAANEVGPSERRCDLLLLLGDARMRAADPAAARASYQEAAMLAERIGAARQAAHAALAVGIDYTFGVSDDVELQLLETALRLEPGEALRARLLARTARALLFTYDLDRRTRLSAEAVALARRCADPATLAAVLVDRHVAVWGAADAADRLDLADEIIQLAHRCDDRALVVQGHALRIANLLELADITAYHVAVANYERLVKDNRLTQLGWHVQLLHATQHLIAGRFDDSEHLIATALAEGHRFEHPSADIWCGSLLTLVKIWRGRSEEAFAMLSAQADELPLVPAIRAGAAVILADTGRLPEARVEFERLAADDFASLPRDQMWLITIAALAVTCHVLDDRPRAAVRYELLLPREPHLVRINHAGTGCSAPVGYHLGVLAMTMARHDVAAVHLRAAIALSERIGAPVFAANARIKMADCLAALGSGTEAESVRQQAREILGALGARPICHPVGAAPSTPRTAELRCEGEYWTVAHAGNSVPLKNSVGLHYLALPLRRPREEIHVLDLVAGQSGGATVAVGDLGPVLDDKAKATYRARLEELADEVTEAESFGDHTRAEAARTEIDSLTEQLTAAYGLGGRDRKTGAHSERARTHGSGKVDQWQVRLSERQARPSVIIWVSNPDHHVREPCLPSHHPRSPPPWTNCPSSATGQTVRRPPCARSLICVTISRRCPIHATGVGGGTRSRRSC